LLCFSRLQDAKNLEKLNDYDKDNNHLKKNKGVQKKKLKTEEAIISHGIPKILHFIKADSKPMLFAEYIAIKSAWVRIQPDLIYYHYLGNTPSGEWADKLSGIVKFNKVAMPFIRNDTSIIVVQHISDFIRYSINVLFNFKD